MHLFKTHLTVKEAAKQKNVSVQAIYQAIKSERLSADYAGAKKVAFISPQELNKVEFKTKKEV